MSLVLSQSIVVATKDMENFSFRLLLTCGELSLGYIMTKDKSVCFVYDHDTTLRLNFSYNCMYMGEAVSHFLPLYITYTCVCCDIFKYSNIIDY